MDTVSSILDNNSEKEEHDISVSDKELEEHEHNPSLSQEIVLYNEKEEEVVEDEVVVKIEEEVEVEPLLPPTIKTLKKDLKIIQARLKILRKEERAKKKNETRRQNYRIVNENGVNYILSLRPRKESLDVKGFSYRGRKENFGHQSFFKCKKCGTCVSLKSIPLHRKNCLKKEILKRDSSDRRRYLLPNGWKHAGRGDKIAKTAHYKCLKCNKIEVRMRDIPTHHC